MLKNAIRKHKTVKKVTKKREKSRENPLNSRKSYVKSEKNVKKD